MNKLLDYAPIGLAKLKTIGDIITSDLSDHQKLFIINEILNKEAISELDNAIK